MPEVMLDVVQPDPDSALIRGLKCGSAQCFDQLLERYQTPIYSFVYRLLDDPSEASDVTQEVFLKVFRKVGAFREDSSLKTWIYRIAVHEASNRRRWFSRHRRREVVNGAHSEETGRTWDLIIDPGESPFDSTERGELRAILDSALRDVDERLRQAVILRDIEGLSYNEISETLEISLGTVKSRILRGREALKKKLHHRLPATETEQWSLQME